MTQQPRSTFVLRDHSEILEALVGLKDVVVLHYERRGSDVEDGENVPTTHVPRPEVIDPGERVVRIRADIVTGRRFATPPTRK